MQVGTNDLEGAGRSGRGAAVSYPITLWLSIREV